MNISLLKNLQQEINELVDIEALFTTTENLNMGINENEDRKSIRILSKVLYNSLVKRISCDVRAHLALICIFIRTLWYIPL